MRILYHDRSTAVCVKPVGVDSEKEMPLLLQAELGCERVFCVHRLDKAVGGVMVYALNGKAAAALSAAFSSRDTVKEYLAAAEGKPAEDSGELRDLLFHDSRGNKTYVVNRMRAGVKEAVLHYDTLETAKGETELTLLRIRLETGRSHQIRVQLASRKLPLAGDARYGSKIRGAGPALWCWHLAVKHPDGKRLLDYAVLPPEAEPWTSFAWICDNRKKEGE